MRIVLVLILPLILFFGSSCDQSQNEIIEQIAGSHIKANVPAADKFDEHLSNDLKTFIKMSYKQDCSIEYQLLRKRPTQVGVAYPKYYLWMSARNDEKLVAEGAIRVAAMDKISFEVTHFVTIEEIKSNPDLITSIFPGPVCHRRMEIMAGKK